MFPLSRVIQKPEKRTTIPEDFQIQPEYEGIPYDLVIDGKIMEKNMDLEVQEQELQKRLDRLEAIEAEIKDREKKLKEKEKAKKQVLLRLAPTLWQELARWAEEDYRSINGQIEFLLAEAVRKRKKSI